jgi:7-cyano-7-deazaguanine synthase in queuosine biosynthesis
MAKRAAAKRLKKVNPGISCKVIGVRSAFKVREAAFEFPAASLWTVKGPIGPNPLTPRVLDLLDLVGGIYRVESQIPPRPTNPAIRWEITASVRDPQFWSSEAGPLLASVLGFLNRALWTFQFELRKNAHEIVLKPTPERKVKGIILFSGGMDSASGAGIHPGAKEQIQLVGYRSTQGQLQRKLATELGYQPPTQWKLKGHKGKEGMDLIRALMFLTLGAAVAETFGASTVYQYENGFLAAAIPPSGNFIPTRHAHPELHLRLERLFKAVFGRPITIKNPFGLLTKREVVGKFVGAAGKDLADSVLGQTETCWRLSQPHVGGETKKPWVPCGVCTPCIVRRTARPEEAKKGAWKGWKGYAYDLNKPKVRSHAKLGLTFRAFLELIEIALTAKNDSDLIEELAPEARALIGGTVGRTSKETADLLRKFATEFCQTFEIAIPSKTA